MALIPPKYLNSLVSIEQARVVSGTTTYSPIASGFLFGDKLEMQDEQGNERYIVFLITNRHVFEDANHKSLSAVHIRLNAEAGAKHYPIQLVDDSGNPLWLKHTNAEVDLAIMPLRGKAFLEERIDYFFFTKDNRSYLARDFPSVGIAPGHGVFVLGFPMGIRGKNKNLIIVRQGIVSRVDEEILKHHYYYIDTSAFPGNSGGPVISKPEMVSIVDTTSAGDARLVGVISTGEVYTDTAVSLQTGRPRVSFEEQTGIVRIVPVESICEIIEPFMTSIKAKYKTAAKKPTTASETKIDDARAESNASTAPPRAA